MHFAFTPIVDVAKIMEGFSAPWFVAGGWAIDLFLGQVTRSHHDIEIGIYRRDQHAIRRHLPNYSLEKCVQVDGAGTWISWKTGEELHLPVHQIRAIPLDLAGKEFELFLNESHGEFWTSRRHPGLRVPMGKATLNSQLNIPILAPEIQLLFKAKQTREKDHVDFDNVAAHLNPSQRSWLAAAMKAYHRGHPWLDRPGLALMRGSKA